MANLKIKRVFTRLYRDNGRLSAYAEWSDGSRTEGEAERYCGKCIPCGDHMGALFDRAMREGVTIEHEMW